MRAAPRRSRGVWQAPLAPRSRIRPSPTSQPTASDDAADAGQRATLSLLLAVFFASGFAALLYQVVWQRLLAIFSGADVFSVTIIVAAFMGGLGCGNWVGGHVADRVDRRRCLALFAAAEVAIGLFALASRWFYYDVLYGRLGALALPTPVLALVLFLAVVWPTFFMGVSLPLLARGMTATLAGAARTVGSLYGWNTLGAATGAFATTWFLLRHFDFATILFVGACINLLCAASVVPLGRRLDREPSAAAADAPDAPAAATPLFGLPTWLALYALSGCVALSLEIAWFRVLGVVVKSTSFTFGTLLAIYLAGVGSGSLVGARRATHRTAHPAARFLALQAAIAIYAAFTLAWLARGMDWMPLLASLRGYLEAPEPLVIKTALVELRAHPLGFVAGSGEPAGVARLFVGLYALLPIVLIAPPTFLMGLSFPYLQRAVQTDAQFLGRRVGWLQSANIAGSLAGSVLTGFVFLPWLGTPGTFRLLVVLACVFIALRPRARGVAPLDPRVLGAAGAALIALVAMPNAATFWARLHAAAPDEILFAEDASGLSLIRPTQPDREEQGHAVLAGGLELSVIPFGAYGGAHTLMGALPVLIHPNPERVGVIGLGSGDTAWAAGGHPVVREVETIEIVGSQIEVLRAFAARHADLGVRGLFEDPRFRYVIGDGRTHVRRDPRKYDVIEADALRPGSAYAGNLYSLEYFALLRASLRPGGLAVTWVPTPRVEATFVKSFPHVLLFEAIAIGSDAPIPFDRDALLARCDEPWVKAYYERVGIDLRAIVERRLAAQAPRRIGPGFDRRRLVDVNSDLFAKDEFLFGSPP
jgi:predicted membrane-bound spermidine synthase